MLILLVGMMVGSASGKDQDKVDLRAYQWKNRLLILFAPAEDASDLSVLQGTSSKDGPRKAMTATSSFSMFLKPGKDGCPIFL